MTDLTARQAQVLAELVRYQIAHGYPPSIRELGQILGMTSTSTVHSHLASLARKGYVRRDPSKNRALQILKTTEESHARDTC